MIDFSRSNIFIAIFWMSGFVLLTFNIGYMLICSMIAIFSKADILNEQHLSDLPQTAIIYVVRNEDKSVLIQNMKASFQNNYKEHIDLWLLSNSDCEESIVNENKVIDHLRSMFGTERVGYFQTRKNVLRRKHVCVHEWLNEQRQYKYFVVCDADSILSEGSVERLIAKAEHPENTDIAVFQSQINVIGQKTYFSNLLGHGQDFCQRIYARANQKVFGRGVSYGSGCLIRCSEFREIAVPEWVLSHDIWDTLSLEEKGYRIVFCNDIITYGSFPNNYIDYLKRSQRWIKGTLESLEVIFRKRVPAGTRFMAFYPVYMYLTQPLFLMWIMSGFFYDSKIWEPLMVTQRYAFLGGSMVDLEMGSHLFITLGIIKLHRFVKCKTFKEIGMVFTELLTSLLLCLNSVLFDSIAVIEWLLFGKKGMTWVPMKKKVDNGPSLVQIAKKLWISTLLGLICLILGYTYSPLWTIIASPFLFSFSFGIPITYLTSKKLSWLKNR